MKRIRKNKSIKDNNQDQKSPDQKKKRPAGSRKRKSYQCEGQLSLFDIDLFNKDRTSIYYTREELIENLRHGDVRGYRTRTIKAGPLLELEIHPLHKPEEAKRAKKIKPSRTVQEKLNHKNTKKKIMRYMNANFTREDLWGTFGYDDAHLPVTPEAAYKDIKNFINRIKRVRKKLRLFPLRYLYVTEWNQDGKSGKVRCHHHIVFSGDLDRDAVEKLWKGGAYPQTRRLRVKEDCGLSGLASYLAKGSRHEKRWGHSTNLKPPVVTVADRKISPRQAARIAFDENAAPAIFEKVCKGYTFREMEAKQSDFAAGVYIYVQMYRRN